MPHEYNITWLCDVFREENLVSGKSLICRDVKHLSRKKFANTSYIWLNWARPRPTFHKKSYQVINMFTKTAKDCMCTSRINFFRTKNKKQCRWCFFKCAVSQFILWCMIFRTKIYYITLDNINWYENLRQSSVFYHLPVHKSNLSLRKLVISTSTP